MLLQTEHSLIFSLASRMASASAKASSGAVRSKWNARRCAVFCPTPGRRLSSSISRAMGAAKSGMVVAAALRPQPARLLFFHEGSPSEQPGDFQAGDSGQSAGEVLHLVGEFLVHAPAGVVDCCADQI